MMCIWMSGCWLASVLPMVAMLAWMAPALVERWKKARPASRMALVLLWMLGAGFLMLRPHDDSFTGLDNMTYRHLSYAFLEGRGFHDPDTVLADVPEALRENFLLHRGPVGRPTRDRVFKLSGWQSVDTQPFFMPTLPLAAAAQGGVLAPERFVPLMGALWLAAMLATGFCAGGGWGLLAVLALVLGTAWPAWFLRGFHAEGVGILLVSAVVATASVRPLRGGVAVVAGFALGMAVTYHPTMVVASVPVALVLWLERKEARTFLALAAGLSAGLFPFWALTRWVCQPYGDWTRWEKLKELVTLAPEHQAIAVVMVVLMTISSVSLWAGFLSPVRARVRRMDAWMNPFGWLVICVMPLVLMATLPPLADGALSKASVAVWSGIRWPYALWMLFGVAWVLRKDRPLRERACLAALCWGALLFLFVQGVETPIGLWSQRRFLPVVLLGIGLLVSPMSYGLSRISGRGWKALALAACAIVCGSNVFRWPAAYVAINEEGAAAWVREQAKIIGSDRLVVFDYYGHAVPYTAGLKHRVLGVGEPSRGHWAEVAEWLTEMSKKEETWVATSWSTCTLEEGAKLEPVFSATGRFTTAHSKSFFPATRGERIVKNEFLRWIPLKEGETADQDKVLDGSPIGLRGPWGNLRNGATWTRQGSHIVGPVPEKGSRVIFEADCAWSPPSEDWATQMLRVTPPWGGAPLRLDVASGEHKVQGEFVRPSNDVERATTGLYSLKVDRPYNPGQNGLRGYESDLGVPMRRIIIRIEPGPASVPE